MADMFCFQCQQTAKNTGCTVNGVCGKKQETGIRKQKKAVSSILIAENCPFNIVYR